MQQMLHWRVCRLPNVLIGELRMWWAGRFDGLGVWELHREHASPFSEEDAGRVREGICRRYAHIAPAQVVCVDLEDEDGSASVW